MHHRSIENSARACCGERNRRRLALTMFLILSLAPSLSQAAFFTWTDSSGKAWYVDTLEKVPPEYRDQAKNPPRTGEMNVGNAAKKDEQAGGSVPHVDRSGKGESYWRGRADELRKQIRLEEDNIAFYKEKRAECEESQKNIITRRRNCSALYGENQTRSEWNIQQVRTKLDVELPEEVRKAGAYPGWLREPQPGPATQPGGAATGPHLDNFGRGERWWRDQADELRRQIRVEEDNLAYYDEQENACVEAQKTYIGWKRNCALKYQSSKQYIERRIKQFKTRLEVELPEEARKANAYAGWVRE
jgi:uncharacterized protein YdaU (DUF1376 family)